MGYEVRRGRESESSEEADRGRQQSSSDSERDSSGREWRPGYGRALRTGRTGTRSREEGEAGGGLTADGAGRRWTALRGLYMAIYAYLPA